MTNGFSLRNLLDDLHKLEINTIEKTAMTAQKMPAPLLAVFEVVEGYESYFAWTLEQQTYNFTVSNETETGQSLKERLQRCYANASMRFNDLATDETLKGQADRMICGRIGRTCEALLGMLRRAEQATQAAVKAGETGPIDPRFLNMTANDMRARDSGHVERAWRLSSSDRALLRKMWEIGTEKVLVQTVIQVEGDVITRISPLIHQNDRDYLLAVHKDGIETSMKMWGELVSLAQSLVAATSRAVGRLIAPSS